MTSRTATLDPNDRLSAWKMAEQRGMTNLTSLSTLQENPPQIVLGLMTLGASEGRQTECQLYQRGRCHYGEQCKYVHVLRAESIRKSEITTTGTRHANGMTSHSKGATESDSTVALTDPACRERMSNGENGNSYPVRHGAADCQYYLKTGKCNYGSRCKFNHPFRDESLVNALNRRDCFDFVQKGTCPYGKNCKYNHPSSSEDLFRNFEQLSTSTSDSSNSSHSPASRAAPRRSASEPRYSTRRDSSEELTNSRPKLSPLGTSHTRGRPMQPASKWETSPDSPATLAKKLANDTRTERISQGSKAAQKRQTPLNFAENPWNSESSSMMPTGLNPGLSAPLQRAPELLQSVPSPLVRRQPVHQYVFPHATSQMPPPSMRSPELRLEGGLLQVEQTASNTWYGQGHADHSVSGRTVTPTALIPASLDRGHIPEASEPEMHLLRTSIWRNNFSVERKESSMDVLTSSFDYGQPHGKRTSVTVRESERPPHKFPLRDRELFQTTAWMGDGGSQLHDGYLLNPAISMPLPTSNVYAIRGEPCPSEFVRAGMGRVQAFTNSWGASGDMGCVDLSSQGMQRLRHQQQIHAQQPQISQHQAQQQAKLQMHHLERYSTSDEIRAESLKMQGLDEKKHEIMRAVPRVQRSNSSDFMSPAEGIGNGTNVDWNRTTFDPMGYKVTAFVHETSSPGASENTSNVWKPYEKSSMFGPGLFGMQHHA